MAYQYKGFSSRFRFNGKEWDEETGNYYYGARYYDPKVSVWLSVDPLAHEFLHVNPYNFVLNNPIMLIDPTGMAPEGGGQYDRLTKAEQRLVKIYPMQALRIKQNAKKATEMTVQVFGHNGKDDESDAFRHAYWQALNSSEVGEYITQKFADAHESETPEGEENSTAMDHHNNKVGIEIGKKNTEASDQELADMVLEKMQNGEMVILDQNGEVVPLETPQKPEVNEPK